jgi:ABC-type antimicrobial peptide transport system permease subunit
MKELLRKKHFTISRTDRFSASTLSRGPDAPDAPAGALLGISGRSPALTRMVARVPAGVPWTDIWHTVALCVAVGVAFAVLAAWRASRGSAVEAIAARE